MSDDLHPLVEVAEEASARPAPPQAIGVAAREEDQQDAPALGEALGGLARSGSAYWLVNLVNFTDGIAYFGILNLLVLYFSQDLHIPDKYASVFVSVMTGLVALFMVPGGAVSDRIGTRNAISVSLALGTLGRGGLWLCAQVPTFAVTPCVLASLLVMAASTGILQPALYAGVKETTQKRLASMGFSLLYAIMNLGIVAESLVSPFVRTESGLNWGIRGVLGCMAGITLLQLLVHLLTYPRNSQLEGEKEAKTAVNYGELLAGRFLFFIFILLPVRTLFAHQWLTIPDYIFRCFPKEVADRYEWFTALNPFVVMIGVPVLCHLTARIHVLRMMIIGTGVSAAATFLLALPPNPNNLIAYVIIFSIGEALWASRFLEYIAELAPPGQVGAYMGVANLPWFVAKVTTGFYSGALLAHFLPKGGTMHPETMWTIYGFIACISPIGLLLAYPWLRAADKEKVS